MRTQILGGGSVLLATLLASTAGAQNAARTAPIQGAVKNAGTYHVATGEWTRAQQTYGILAQDALYRNDLASGYFGLLDQDEIFHDELRLPGDGQPLLPGQPETGTSDGYKITGFQFGYCALNTGATSATLSYLESYTPCGNPGGVPVAASFQVTGLPNGGCWIIAFDLTGTTGEFTLAAEGGDGLWDNDAALDNGGAVFNINDGQGNGTGQLTTGPILSGNNNQLATQGDGTKFKNPGIDGTGLGTEDLFWLISPVVADGCYFYGGCFPCANFNHTVFGEDDDGGPIAYCNPGNANSVSANGAVLTSTGGYLTNNAAFNVSSTPNQPGVLFTGPAQIDLPFGCGRRCVGGAGVIRYGPFFPSGNQLNVTIDMTPAMGNRNTQYWYRDPAFGGCGGQFFNLSNALTQ